MEAEPNAPMLKRAIMLAFHLVQHENEVTLPRGKQAVRQLSSYPVVEYI
jgi:hypothetical protein